MGSEIDDPWAVGYCWRERIIELLANHRSADDVQG
jgi:hypothetical protein